jgi:hypothetical protein
MLPVTWAPNGHCNRSEFSSLMLHMSPVLRLALQSLSRHDFNKISTVSFDAVPSIQWICFNMKISLFQHSFDSHFVNSLT